MTTNELSGFPAGWALSRTVDSPQGTVHWDVFGSGPPIVLLHGTPNWSYIWRKVVPSLASEHQVYVFDWPGFGRSDRFAGQNISWDEQPRRLPELFAHWGLDAPMVVAFDFAAVFALRAHLLEGLDVGAFVLADAAVIPPFVTDFSRLARENIGTMRALPVHVAEGMIAAHLARTTHRPMAKETAAAYLAPWRGEEGVAAYWRVVARYDEDLAAPLVSRLDRLAVPTRLLWGEHDAWFPADKARELAAALPDAELRFIPGAGHFSPEDDPAAFAEEVRRFHRELGQP
ncbi:Pimeloyl-ACP methyl ester carboxylesterase [Amycolatopsis arida]|uniref:Pimeloyl-ACP methyl ester carboxylesterase n=1 Tax=Amycolatopsis arida TaxID=587909 RepID=A0A1I5WJ01_9PSEU|nr:alpha/beta fold hydrolase [Amycolatopsis arida]TDX92295.1 pimeloyl-ACP methyl ester carboxylesterase [Amycolatopsis arida]SFQ19366.1 Pimeloyl-ACP methyl ester carboxylesterase [Amycolatopsis arida]